MKTNLCNKDEYEKMYSTIDVLLLQDGGCAPGYNPVTAFLTAELEKAGRETYVTREGFKSLISGTSEDFRKLAYSKSLFKTLEHIPGVIHAAPLSDARGADFRSERFREFKLKENQKKAAKTIKQRKVKAIIAIGGNGTLFGTRSLTQFIDPSIQVFFIPVTIDSDVSHTECIGEYTGIEIGSEKIRRYKADARTHQRIYIIELMGARGGFHALQSALGARAHLAVIPGATFNMKKVAQALANREEAVIVIAEGYKEEQREKEGFTGNAAEYFYKEILATGIPINRKVVCEPFSRDLRGATANNLDTVLCEQMAYLAVKYLKEGNNYLMPCVNSGKSGAVHFDMIDTDNQVKHDLFKLSNRLY